MTFIIAAQTDRDITGPGSLSPSELEPGDRDHSRRKTVSNKEAGTESDQNIESEGFN